MIPSHLTSADDTGARNMTTHEEHQQMVTDCENRESKLTDWERGFIDSIARQIAAGRALSEKQAERLDAIWERVT